MKDGRLRAAAESEGLPSLSEQPKENAKSSRQLGETGPSPRFNSMAVKDGRLRAAERSKQNAQRGCQLGKGPFAARSEGRTSFSELSKKNAKSSRQLARAAARAETRLPVVFLLEGVL